MTLRTKIEIGLANDKMGSLEYNDNIGFGTIRIKASIFSKYDELTLHLNREVLIKLKKELNEKLK